MNAKSVVIPVVAVAVLMAIQSNQSSAAVIKFNDTTETISATLDGNAVATCLNENQCFVALPNFLKDPVANPFRAQFKLTEPGTQETSDVIQFAVFLGDPKELDIFLFSDPITATLPSEFYGSTDETGKSQTIPLPRNLPPLAAGNRLSVEVASDVERIPEPGALQLMAAALLALGMCRRFRKASGPTPRLGSPIQAVDEGAAL